jgi:UDP-N-acetylmuramate-alanine ligase
VDFVGELDLVCAELPAKLAAGDLVITFGAGNVTTLGPRLLDGLRAGAHS